MLVDDVVVSIWSMLEAWFFQFSSDERAAGSSSVMSLLDMSIEPVGCAAATVLNGPPLQGSLAAVDERAVSVDGGSKSGGGRGVLKQPLLVVREHLWPEQVPSRGVRRSANQVRAGLQQ